MRDTMDYLLALRPEERDALERAEAFDFTAEGGPPQASPAAAASAGRAPGRGPPEIEAVTVNLLTVEAAELLCRHGRWPAVLSFAHGHNCGGGFEHASGSQEESLFRDTSIFLSLWPHRRADDGAGVLARGMWIGEYDDKLPRREPFYPQERLGCIYSPYVRMCRKAEPGNPLWPAQQLCDAPYFGVVTMAAQDVNREPVFDHALLRQKARCVLHVAAEQRHDALVLGAFGCGYFRNPPQAVARVFRELLDTEFAGTFAVVVFAIPGRGHANMAEFERAFPLVEKAKLEEQLQVLAASSSGSPRSAEQSLNNNARCNGVADGSRASSAATSTRTGLPSVGGLGTIRGSGAMGQDAPAPASSMEGRGRPMPTETMSRPPSSSASGGPGSMPEELRQGLPRAAASKNNRGVQRQQDDEDEHKVIGCFGAQSDCVCQ